MHSTHTISTNQIRTQFTQAMSKMYQLEVPLYKRLLSLVDTVNGKFSDSSAEFTEKETNLLGLEHHGAIRVGSASELSMIRRLFSVMGMQPVDYYDLSVAGIPVHSTAFRALNTDDLKVSPFRVFCSLLRLDLIEEFQLRKQASEILDKRQIFPKELLKLIDLSEKQGGLTSDEAHRFIDNALEVFRWHKNATVDSQTYDKLKASHGLIADIVSFKGPHINHLTPKVLDIDECQNEFSKKGIKAKAFVEGPPRRKCPILLRQTSFIAIAEKVKFSDGELGEHTARFGEVEQRGIALTPKGRQLYDQLLLQAKNVDGNIDYTLRLNKAFKKFPDTYKEIRQQELGYFYYTSTVSKKSSKVTLEKDQSYDLEALITARLIQVSPMIYEDFLPVSAAGIFTSNLTSEIKKLSKGETTSLENNNQNQQYFENALGIPIVDSFSIYSMAQQESLRATLITLGFDM